MKRKGSMMGTSKYEFSPKQFDIDMARHRVNREARELEFERVLRELIEADAFHAKERYYLIIDTLRKIREDYL